MGDWTPGPWEKNRLGELIGSNGHRVSHYNSGLVTNLTRDAQSEANARLISSAPELYEALKSLLAADPALRTHGIGAPHSPVRNAQVAKIEAEDNAIAALSKAEGKDK